MRVFAINQAIDASLSEISTDKSISHRCAIFSLLSEKKSKIKGYLMAQDCQNTLEIIKLLGARVENDGEWLIITPPAKIAEPKKVLECGNSGTAMRLFMGLLAAQEGFFVLSGDEYLNERPMARVANPLKSVGAAIDGRENGDKAPLCIRGKKLEFFSYKKPR